MGIDDSREVDDEECYLWNADLNAVCLDCAAYYHQELYRELPSRALNFPGNSHYYVQYNATRMDPRYCRIYWTYRICRLLSRLHSPHVPSIRGKHIRKAKEENGFLL